MSSLVYKLDSLKLSQVLSFLVEIFWGIARHEVKSLRNDGEFASAVPQWLIAFPMSTITAKMSAIYSNIQSVKNVCRLLPVVQRLLSFNRYLAKAIPRGQDPQKVAEMPVFQYVSDKRSPKKKNLVYLWGYSGGGALGRIELIKRVKYKYERQRPPIIVIRRPIKSDFVDIQTNVLDVSAGYGFTVSHGKLL